MACHGSKVLNVRNIFESIVLNNRTEIELPLDVLEFVKNWPGYCKEIFNGNENFTVDGMGVDFEAMQKFITLLNCPREDRKLAKSLTKEASKEKKQKTGMWHWFVGIMWDLLASTREVEKIDVDDNVTEVQFNLVLLLNCVVFSSIKSLTVPFFILQKI